MSARALYACSRVYPQREKNIRLYHQSSLEESLLSLRGAEGREGRREGGIPWIGGRERPRARRRTTGCVTQSPVHRQRASERSGAARAAWIRVESLRRHLRWGTIARSTVARAQEWNRAESPSARACVCVSGGRAKADGRGESCSVRRMRAADGRGRGEAGNAAASSSDARGDGDGGRGAARRRRLGLRA